MCVNAIGVSSASTSRAGESEPRACHQRGLAKDMGLKGFYHPTKLSLTSLG